MVGVEMNLKALREVGCGLYVVISKKGDRFNYQIADTVFHSRGNVSRHGSGDSKEVVPGDYASAGAIFGCYCVVVWPADNTC